MSCCTHHCLYLAFLQAREASFRTIKTIAECLADEIVNASKVTCVVRTRTLMPQLAHPYTQPSLRLLCCLASLVYTTCRARLAATPSRRRTSWSALPRATDKCTAVGGRPSALPPCPPSKLQEGQAGRRIAIRALTLCVWYHHRWCTAVLRCVITCVCVPRMLSLPICTQGAPGCPCCQLGWLVVQAAAVTLC